MASASPGSPAAPKNFEDSLRLKFYNLTQGSVGIPICREAEAATQQDRWQFEQPDELDEAVELVTEAVLAADTDRPLPEALPKNILPLFENYGRTLREDEAFELRPQTGKITALYGTVSRGRLLRFAAGGYTDRVDFVGEVREVDLAGRFEIRMEDGAKVPARFSPQQEAVVTEALRDHASRRLRVMGIGEFQPDGKMKSILSVSALETRPAGESAFDPTAKPIWDIIQEIGAAVPAAEWANVPKDGAQNLDHYLYGHAKRS